MTKVIIVENDAVSQNKTVQVVAAMGHTAIRCIDGKMALESLMEHPDTALVVTDVDSGAVGGDALMQAMRADGRLARIPIVATSRASKRSDYVRIVVLGATCCIRKPVDSDELQGVVQRHVGFGEFRNVAPAARKAMYAA